MNVFPEFGAVGGLVDLHSIVGALLMLVLLCSALTLIVSAIAWALAASSGNYHAAHRARVGALVALGAAARAGAALPILDFLLAVGAEL